MRVSSPLVARFGAVAAAAAIAVTGATAAASASTAAPAAGKVATALSIHESMPVTHRHQITAIIAGRLTEPNESNHAVRFKAVWLERQGPKGHWYLVKGHLTNRRGWVAFRVHVKKSASFRLIFLGSANFARSVSSAVTIS